jgi:GNAT superfamily N-acetyltransferase
MIKILRVTPLTIADFSIEHINRLLFQQSPNSKERIVIKNDLAEALVNPFFYFFIMTDSERPDRYIGMASIFFQRNLARWIGEIHDVVVDERERGRGLGEKLVKELMETARKFCAEREIEMKLFLTSRPSRIAANNLYAKLGFVLVAKSHGSWGTNLYKIIAGPAGFRGLS